MRAFLIIFCLGVAACAPTTLPEDFNAEYEF